MKTHSDFKLYTAKKEESCNIIMRSRLYFFNEKKSHFYTMDKRFRAK